MDQELQEKNPEDTYLTAVKADIKSYADEDKTITSYTIDSTNEVTYKTVNGQECAYVDVSYFVQEKKNANKASQTYVLRKDANGNWKILGFYQ